MRPNSPETLLARNGRHMTHFWRGIVLLRSRDIASFLKKEKGVTWLLAPVDGRGRACVGRSLWWQCDRMVPEEAIVWSHNTYNLVLTMLTDGLRLRFREIQAKLP